MVRSRGTEWSRHNIPALISVLTFRIPTGLERGNYIKIRSVGVYLMRTMLNGGRMLESRFAHHKLVPLRAGKLAIIQLQYGAGQFSGEDDEDRSLCNG